MDKRFLESILTNLTDKLNTLKNTVYHSRQAENAEAFANHVPTLCVAGVRGAGKTALCFHLLNKASVKWAYINFDEPRLAQLGEADINDILEVLYKINGNFTHVLIDNPQQFAAWPALSGTLIAKEVTIWITTSSRAFVNNCIIPADIPVVDLDTLSFVEYCAWHNVNHEKPSSPMDVASLRIAFDDYLARGGMPAVQNSIRYTRYLNALVEEVITDDIERKPRQVNREDFIKLATYLLSSSPYPASYSRLVEMFDIRSENSIKRYIETIADTYLVDRLRKFAMRDRQRNINEKIYAADPAFLTQGNESTEDFLSRRLETILYQAISRYYIPRGFRVHYFADRAAECDFAICRNMKMEIAIHTIYDISNERLLRRKVSGLLALSKLTGCERLVIITDNQNRDITVQNTTIAIRPAFSLLCGHFHEVLL